MRVPSEFTAEYLIGCKYPTRDMPIRFKIKANELPVDASADELLNFYQESCEEHFLQNVSCDYQNEAKFLAWAVVASKAEKP